MRKLRDKARDALVAHLTGQAIPKSEEQLEQLLGEAAVLSRAAQMSEPFDNILSEASSSARGPANPPITPEFPTVTPNSFELPILDTRLFGQDPALQWLTSCGAPGPSQLSLNQDIAFEQSLLQPEAQPGPGLNTFDLLHNWSTIPVTDIPSCVPSNATSGGCFDLPVGVAQGVAPDIDWNSIFRDL